MAIGCTIHEQIRASTFSKRYQTLAHSNGKRSIQYNSYKRTSFMSTFDNLRPLLPFSAPNNAKIVTVALEFHAHKPFLN